MSESAFTRMLDRTPDPERFARNLAGGAANLAKAATPDFTLSDDDRQSAAANDLYETDGDLRVYGKGLWTYMQERPVIYPDMVNYYRQEIFGDSELPITVEEYIRRKADALTGMYQRLGVEVDPGALVQQVQGVLHGKQADKSSLAAQYADDVLNTLQKGSASYQNPHDMTVTQEQFDQASKLVAGGSQGSPEHAVPRELQRYFATQAVYDYMRAMQDGNHAPPYANAMSNVAAGVGSLFDWTGGAGNTFADMGFRHPLAGRASQAMYWANRADTAIPPVRFTPSVRRDAWRIGADPIREEQRQQAGDVNRAVAFRDAGGNAMYPHWSTTNMTGLFGDGTYPGTNYGADHPYGRLNSQWYRNFAEFSRSPMVGLIEPQETHARGVMYPARTDADMDQHMNRVMPIIPAGMTREHFADFYDWRQGDEAKGEAFAETMYPETQAHFGVPKEQRTWGPQWYTTLAKAPQNALGDLSYAGMTAATAGYGGLSGGMRAFGQGLTRLGGKAATAGGVGALASQTASGAARGLGRGTMSAALDTAVDAPSDYITEQGIGYGMSNRDNFAGFFTDTPEQSSLLPNVKPTDSIRTIVQARNQAMEDRESEYRNRIDEWNMMRGNAIPAASQPRRGFRTTEEWSKPNWYMSPQFYGNRD